MYHIVDHIKNSPKAKVQLLFVFLLFIVVILIIRPPHPDRSDKHIKPLRQSISVEIEVDEEEDQDREMDFKVGAPKPADDDKSIKEATEAVKSSLPRLKEKSGVDLRSFEVLEVHRQVVAGTNFFVRIKGETLEGDEKYIHLKIYRNLLHIFELTAYKTDKGADDKLEYF